MANATLGHPPLPAHPEQHPSITRSHLKPGGRLVYSTCSLEREENEDVVAGLAVQETHLRLPGRDPGDGFFAL